MCLKGWWKKDEADIRDIDEDIGDMAVEKDSR
jgi:hypothetical protein